MALLQHPGYTFGNAENDIALMKLETPADVSSDYIEAINLSSTNENFTRTDCYLTGWGAPDGELKEPIQKSYSPL